MVWSCRRTMMVDVARLRQLVDQLRKGIDELAMEIGRAQEPATEGTTIPSTRSMSVATPAPGVSDLPNVIRPTLTDDPSSIVGGHPTIDFPDCCAVGDDASYYCTGTLIAPNVVVTAGHCEDETGKGPTRVFLGGVDVTQPDTGETIAVAGDFKHDEADLRVLVLDQDASVEPRHVARGSEVPAESEVSVRLAGFGTIDLGGRVGYGIKREVDVPLTSVGCDFPGDAEQFGCRPGTELVAGQRGLNRDSCRGDSGGPLYVQTRDGAYALLGATSRGVVRASNVCGDGGIYVRVDRFLDWISEKTGATIA
jgi:hypothetical protein